MTIDSIKNGIVIDHIKAGKGMYLYEVLGLEKLDCSVAIIKNGVSQKLGKKDIIKIDSLIDLDLDVLGYVDPGITVNIIRDGVTVEKKKLSLPERVVKRHQVQESQMHDVRRAGASPYIQAHRQGEGRLQMHLLRKQG